MLHAINSRETEHDPRTLPRTFARPTRAPRRVHAQLRQRARGRASTYIFGEFELDEARFELRRLGVVVVVQPKALRLLLHLIVHRERAVAADELFAELWPDERVSTASIKRAVLGARRALGERGESQRSIRTVRGYGYQFALPVEVVRGDLPAARTTQVHEGARVSIELAGVTRSELADMLSKLYGSCLPETRLRGRVVLCLDQPAL